MTSYVKQSHNSVTQLRRIDRTFKSNDPGNYGPDTSTTSYTSMPSNWVDSLSGIKVPNWRQLIEEGKDANSPMLASETSLKALGSTGSAYAYRKRVGLSVGKWFEESQTVVYGLAQVAKPSLPSMVNEEYAALNLAKARLVSRIREAQSAFSGGVYLGEAREAIRMLTGGTRGIARGIERYLARARGVARKSKRIPRSKREQSVTKSLSDLWLATQYGILPLAGDVHSAGEALARLDDLGKLRPQVIVKARARKTKSSLVDLGTGFKDQWFFAGPPVIKVDYCLRDDDAVTVELRACVKVKNEGLSGMFDFLGMNFQDLGPTIWELTPWSFLADYFTNIGEVVSAASLNKAAVTWCWQTVRTQRARRFDRCELDINYFNQKYPWDGYNLSRRTYWSRPSVAWHLKRVDRQNHGVNLTPEVTFEIPGLTSWRKWANMSALTLSAKETRRLFSTI